MRSNFKRRDRDTDALGRFSRAQTLDLEKSERFALAFGQRLEQLEKTLPVRGRGIAGNLRQNLGPPIGPPAGIRVSNTSLFSFQLRTT